MVLLMPAGYPARERIQISMEVSKLAPKDVCHSVVAETSAVLAGHMYPPSCFHVGSIIAIAMIDFLLYLSF